MNAFHLYSETFFFYYFLKPVEIDGNIQKVLERNTER